VQSVGQETDVRALTRQVGTGVTTKIAAALLAAVALFAFQLVRAQSGSAATGDVCLQTGMETVATDADDYAPGLVVHVSGSGYGMACDVQVNIHRPDGVTESATVTTDAFGNLAYDYQLPPPPGVIGTYGLDVVGSGTLASMTFTDAGVKMNKLFSDAALANEDYQFTTGDTVVA